MSGGKCYYFGWFALEMWCKHPDHPYQLKALCKGCSSAIDVDQKLTKNSIPWPEPIAEKPT